MVKRSPIYIIYLQLGAGSPQLGLSNGYESQANLIWPDEVHLIFLTPNPVAVGSHPQAAKHTADQLAKQKSLR